VRTISEPKPEELGRGPLSYLTEVSSWHTPHWSGAPVSHELQNTSVNQLRDQQGKNQQLWVTLAENLCVSSRVRTSSSDPTHELEAARIFLLHEGGTLNELTGYILRQWSITPTRPGEPVAAKTFACVNTEFELCGLMEPEDPPVELVVTAQLGTFQRTSGVHLDPTLLQRLRTSCEVEPMEIAVNVPVLEDR